MAGKTAFQIERIAFFSDAVFAIAITLLVIEIHAPVFTAETSIADAYGQFLHLIPEFISVIISFALIAMNWRRHFKLFGVLNNFDARLVTLNFLWLSAIIFLPFSTAFIAKSYSRFWIAPITLPFVIYCFNNWACAVFNYFTHRYALDPKNGLYDPAELPEAPRIKLEILYAVIVFSVAIVVGFVNHFAGMACFALFSVEGVFLKMTMRKQVVAEEGSA